MLVDHQIRALVESGVIKVSPIPSLEQYQPASLDVRLGKEFIRFHERRGELDVRNPGGRFEYEYTEQYEYDHPVTIKPGEFLLGTTLERITLYERFMARIEGRSSIGRLGVTVHVTAGFIDPGFNGQITLEIANLNRYPVTLYTGMRVAQLAFQRLELYPEKTYSGRYQGQTGVTSSRIK